jgi:Predicted pyridoxal phosphate-dependent enzyme apparently involved in regulation of cell wall biogenesis
MEIATCMGVFMRDSFLVFGQPLIGKAEIEEVVDSMEKAWLGTGPKVHRFERTFPITRTSHTPQR